MIVAEQQQMCVFLPLGAGLRALASILPAYHCLLGPCSA